MARFPAARQQLLRGPGGLSPTGLSPTRLSPAGLSPAGLSPTGLSPTRLSPAGLSPAGLSPTGLSPAGLRCAGRRRRRVGELPVGIFLRAFQARVAQLEARDLERLVLGQAVDAADAAVGPLHESPFGFAGHRVGIDLAQIALRGRLARVLEQVIERARVLGFPR